jgi:Alginate lyase
MRPAKQLILAIIILFVQQMLFAQTPKLYLINAEKVAAIKNNAATNKATADNIKQLAKQADKLLPQHFGSVMDKTIAPPCGNMHEYFSMAKYYWPDPTKPDGKPFIKKDGQKNPENDKVSDDKNFDAMVSAVNTLSWAYYFTNEEKYAKKSIELLRIWFLDTATCMLPNLNHAQMRTGIDTGVSTGIIDTHEIPKVTDAIGLLAASTNFTKADEQGLKEWFAAYLKWLRTSKNGKKESEAKNNHGTFYDVQIVAIALFCGENEVADKMLQTTFARLANQIEPDGKQPLELERTLAMSYSTFNLEAWSLLANAAETRGVDLWNYKTADGRSIKKAIDYLAPYVVDAKQWEYQQINTYKTYDYYRLLLIAADKFKDDTYRKQADKIKDSNKNIFTKLFYE